MTTLKCERQWPTYHSFRAIFRQATNSSWRGPVSKTNKKTWLDLRIQILNTTTTLAKSKVPALTGLGFFGVNLSKHVAIERDMTRQGIFFYSDVRPLVGEEIVFVMKFPRWTNSSPTACKGKVVRVEQAVPGDDIGVALSLSRFLVLNKTWGNCELQSNFGKNQRYNAPAGLWPPLWRKVSKNRSGCTVFDSYRTLRLGADLR